MNGIHINRSYHMASTASSMRSYCAHVRHANNLCPQFSFLPPHPCIPSHPRHFHAAIAAHVYANALNDTHVDDDAPTTPVPVPTPTHTLLPSSQQHHYNNSTNTTITKQKKTRRRTTKNKNLNPLQPDVFSSNLTNLQQWYAKYLTTVVPKSAHDAGYVGHWVSDIRRLHKQGTMPQWALDAIHAANIDMEWSVDVLTAKWHSNFHLVREFKEQQESGEGEGEGEGLLPPEYWSEERADWVEAARWLERQRELYRGEKLTDYRVWALKRVLGVGLKREYAPRRKNMHPVLIKANEEFRKRRKKMEGSALN